MTSLLDFKDFLTIRDLIKIGLFVSSNAAYQAKLKGNIPQFLKVGHKILFPKEAVVRFIQERLQTPKPTEKKLLVSQGQYINSPNAKPFKIIPLEPTQESVLN